MSKTAKKLFCEPVDTKKKPGGKAKPKPQAKTPKELAIAKKLARTPSTKELVQRMEKEVSETMK